VSFVKIRLIDNHTLLRAANELLSVFHIYIVPESLWDFANHERFVSLCATPQSASYAVLLFYVISGFRPGV
jgi:hypothetical protein